jgi:hypothetical protein
MRRFLTRDDLSSLAGKTFPGRTLGAVTRLAGGTTKGVYRLAFEDGFTCVAYRWHADENYWPAQTIFDVGPFTGHGTRARFLDRHALLTGLGVAVPSIYAVDTDLALVQDLRGGSLEALLERDPPAGRTVLARLATSLTAMHSDLAPADYRPEDPVLERGRRALAEAAARVPVISAVRAQLDALLSDRFAAIAPRQSCGVIHGELGPDHVLVDDAGRPVLIDIEGTMRFDPEWEHAFLELRFGPELYPALRTVELDMNRLRLCRLTQYLSLVAGPLLLLDGDFPRPDGMREIASSNVPRVLAELSS